MAGAGAAGGGGLQRLRAGGAGAGPADASAVTGPSADQPGSASTWRSRPSVSCRISARGSSCLVYRDFLPAALADGRYRAVPEPQVVGTGLGAVQTALDVPAAGVSARKVVVTL